MNARRKVTEAEAMGEVAPDEVAEPQQVLRNRYTTRGPLVTVAPDMFDRIRLEAYYESRYGNTHTEQQTVQAVDEAIFKRVREFEQITLNHAAATLDKEDVKARTPEHRPNTLQRAERHRHALMKLRDEIARGEVSTAELADQFGKIQRAVKTRDGASLLALSDRARSQAARLADPYGRTQAVVAKMPIQNWVSLGVARW